MPDVSAGTLSLDLTQYLADLDKAGAAASQLLTTVQAAGDATTAKFSQAAQAQVQFSEKLASATAEVRNAQAATRSAADEVRRLADANRELATQQSGLKKSSDEYIRLKGLIAANNEEIKKAKVAINENKQATEQERAAVQAVRDARREETNQTKLSAAAAKDAAAATKQQAQAQDAAGQSGGFLSGVLGKATAAFAGLFAVNKLKQIAEDVVETTAEFQRLEAVLTTINNGDNGKAERQFAELRAFTLRNPFEVKEVTEGYVTLRNVGINPTIKELQSLADLAAASGKSFDTVTSSLLGATTGRFVQLKQFGITAKQQGDTVAFTFRGVTTVVEKTQKAISDYVFGLGQLNSVQGATERIMNTTGGRITNLKDSLTELFNVIGEGTDGPMNSFIKKLTQMATSAREAVKSTDQKALDRLADTGALESYAKVADGLFARAREQMKRNGYETADILAVGFKQTFEQQQLVLEKQLAKAQAAVKSLPEDYTPEYVARYARSGEGLTDRAVIDRAEADRVAAKQREALIKGEIGVLKERYEVVLKGDNDENKALGLILAKEKLITELQERQKATSTTRTKEANGADFLLGAGGLDEQLKKARKELQELLGQEEKTRQKQTISYESQLRALLQERATLTSLAAKAATDSADDAAGKARAIFTEALRQVDVVQGKLEQRELDLRKQAQKAGGSRAVAGLGEKADGTVDGVQAQQLTQLRLAALDKYYADLYKITAEREQRLFELRADSDEKQVEAIDRKYNKLIKANTDGIERQAIEEARQREQLALRAQVAQRASDQQTAIDTSRAGTLGDTYGPGTGVSVFEAKRAEKRKLLEIEGKHAKDVLNNSLLLAGKEGEIQRAAAERSLAQIQQQKRALEGEEKLADFSIYKLIFGENDSEQLRKALDEVANSVISSLQSIVQSEQQAAASRASTATQAINELGSQLNAEIALRNEGSASNIKTIQAEIAEQKQVRREALEDQRKAAQEQVIIDALSQASSITTAAANVFEAFSSIPYVGVALGIAAAGVLIGGFTAAKVKAYQAAGKIGGTGYFDGGFTPDGGKYEEAGTVHKGEFIARQELVRDYRPLFAALHEGRPQDIDWSSPKLTALLPNFELPGQLRAEKAEAQRVQHEHSFSPMKAEFAQMHGRLEAIEKSNERMASRWDTHPTETGFMLIDPETNSIHRITT